VMAVVLVVILAVLVATSPVSVEMLLV